MVSDGWNALKAHLEREAVCLASMEALLLREQQALRTLDAAALTALARQRAEAVEAHTFLAHGRKALLCALAPESPPANLSAVRTLLPVGAQDELARLQQTLAALVQRVQRLQSMNEAYAETGRQTVERALTRLVRRRAGPETTYGADGRVNARSAAGGVREQG